MLRALEVPLAVPASVLERRWRLGTMLGRSLLTLVLLTVAVICATAQHAPPVGELEPRARRGAYRRRGDAGAGMAGRGWRVA